MSSSETQAQLVGGDRMFVVKVYFIPFTTNILSFSLTAPGSPKMMFTERWSRDQLMQKAY